MAKKLHEKKAETPKAEITEKAITDKVLEIKADQKADVDGRVKDLHSDRMVFETADAYNEYLKKQAE